MLGVVRVSWLVPEVGERAAELIEAPVMLLAILASARFVTRRFPAAGKAAYLASGGLALGLLLAVELSVVLALRGLTIGQYLEERDPVAGGVYVLMLLIFAAMPAWVGKSKAKHRRRLAILQDDPGRPEVAALLQRHLAAMAKHSPPESIHALDVEGLRSPEITFWSAWDGAELMGCGALKQLDPTHGEIKSMHTAAAHLRQGVASLVLEHIIGEARRRGYVRLSLETGSGDAYLAARNLYARFGFEVCGPFADYVLDPHSVFMTREL